MNPGLSVLLRSNIEKTTYFVSGFVFVIYFFLFFPFLWC
uniref:Uncharacterized protein n=1 Tax=Arundo donax TaxID=35708 RepID=A0A0A8YPY8_ARUDO